MNELIDYDYCYNFWMKRNSLSFIYDLENRYINNKKHFNFKQELINILDNRNIGNIGTYLLLAFGSQFINSLLIDIEIIFNEYKKENFLYLPLKVKEKSNG